MLKIRQRDKIRLKKYVFILLVILLLWFFISKYLNYLKPKPKFQFFSVYHEFRSKRLNKFLLIHNTILTSKANEYKKIIFNEPYKVGYANKLYAILTSLFIAIINESALILDWPEIAQYINPPLIDVFTQFDDESHFNLNFKSTQNLILPEETENSWKYEKNLKDLINNYVPNYNRIVYKGFAPYLFELSANPIYYNKLLEYGLVKNETILKANEALSNDNMNEFEKIERLYMIGFEVGSTLLNEFWLIKPSFLNEINSFYNDNLKDYFVIGMQFRLEYLNEDDDIGRFVKCAEYIQRLNKVSNRVKWFVTSDSERIFKLLKKFTKGIEIVQGKGRIGHIIEDPNNYYRTIMDNELLSRSNEIIITGGSTYGFVASMKKGKLPYYIEGKRKYEVNEREECKIMTFNRGPRNQYGDSVI